MADSDTTSELGPSSAIVLAGGRSRRFGAPKLQASLDGRPLLEYAVRTAVAVCEQTLVVGAADGPAPTFPAELAAQVELIIDARPFEGPLVAAVDAAHRVRHERLLLIAGDMPWLHAGVLLRLLAFGAALDGARLADGEALAVLPLGLRRSAVIEQGGAQAESGQRSLMSLLDRLDLEIVPEAEWRSLDPDGRSLRDVDRPADLEA